MIITDNVSKAVATNNTIIALAEVLGVKSYIIAPCIVCKLIPAFKSPNVVGVAIPY